MDNYPKIVALTSPNTDNFAHICNFTPLIHTLIHIKVELSTLENFQKSGARVDLRFIFLLSRTRKIWIK